MNSYIAKALHKYINAKKPRALGATIAGTQNGGGTPQQGFQAAKAVATASSQTTPENVGQKAAKNLRTAPPGVQAAGAANAAKQHALAIGYSVPAANKEAVNAAENAASQRPSNQANAAVHGAVAAGAPVNKRKTILTVRLKALVNQDTSSMTPVSARTEKQALSNVLRQLGEIPKNLQNKVSDYSRRLNNKTSSNLNRLLQKINSQNYLRTLETKNQRNAIRATLNLLANQNQRKNNSKVQAARAKLNSLVY